MSSQVGAIGNSTDGREHRLLDFDQYYMVRVTIDVTGPIVNVEFSHQEDRCTFEYMLENWTTSSTMRVRQVDVSLRHHALENQVLV
jgi:hypothetical protein